MSKEKYDTTILELVQLIQSSNVSATNKGEFFGYFLDRIIHRYIQMQESKSDQFNANLFPAATRKNLEMLSNRLATLIGSSDPVEASGDLHYVITEVLRQLGQSTTGTAGMGVFLKGCVYRTLNKIQINTDNTLGVDPKDRVMASRRRVVATGVLCSVNEKILVV